VLVQYYARSLLMLFTGKVVATLGFGLGHSVAPVLVSEIAPSEMRGICLALIVSLDSFRPRRLLCPTGSPPLLTPIEHDDCVRTVARILDGGWLYLSQRC
jgi:MFS family permease